MENNETYTPKKAKPKTKPVAETAETKAILETLQTLKIMAAEIKTLKSPRDVPVSDLNDLFKTEVTSQSPSASVFEQVKASIETELLEKIVSALNDITIEELKSLIVEK